MACSQRSLAGSQRLRQSLDYTLLTNLQHLEPLDHERNEESRR